MADALSKINFLPLCHHHGRLHQHISLSPSFYNLNSAISSSNSQRQSLFGKPSLPFSSSDSYGKAKGFDFQDLSSRDSLSPPRSSSISHSGFRIPKAQKWWEKELKPNMKEVNGAKDLVDTLLNAEDKLVVVDFFSPGCGGCKALHPKLCQLAEMNPDVLFLQVNYEDHKSMCYSLGVHVLPFFRFYRGAHGRLASFSCTNATIKKFKDALAKHNTPRCSLGPNKGLEDKELEALSSNKDLSFNYTPQPVEQIPVPVPVEGRLPLPLPSTILKSSQVSKENAYVR